MTTGNLIFFRKFFMVMQKINDTPKFKSCVSEKGRMLIWELPLLLVAAVEGLDFF